MLPEIAEMTVISAFSAEQAERLTRVSMNQLRYWNRTGFFAPSLVNEDGIPFGRVYSFRDLVCLQVLNALRNEGKIPLQYLREVKKKLVDLGEDMWAKTTLYVLNRKVLFVNPDTGYPEEVLSGQLPLQIPLEPVQANMRRAVRDLQARDPKTIGKIQRKRGVAGNKPVVAGTRIPVATIKAFHDQGYPIEKIREQYPELTEEDVRAALAHCQAA